MRPDLHRTDVQARRGGSGRAKPAIWPVKDLRTSPRASSAELLRLWAVILIVVTLILAGSWFVTS